MAPTSESGVQCVHTEGILGPYEWTSYIEDNVFLSKTIKTEHHEKQVDCLKLALASTNRKLRAANALMTKIQVLTEYEYTVLKEECTRKLTEANNALRLSQTHLSIFKLATNKKNAEIRSLRSIYKMMLSEKDAVIHGTQADMLHIRSYVTHMETQLYKICTLHSITEEHTHDIANSVSPPPKYNLY